VFIYMLGLESRGRKDVVPKDYDLLNNCRDDGYVVMVVRS